MPTGDDRLRLVYDEANDCYTVAHYNANPFEELLETGVYLLGDYQPAATRLLEMETATQLQKLWRRGTPIYGVGIGYGALTLLQTLPYCQRNYFEEGALVLIDPTVGLQKEIEGYHVVTRGWNPLSSAPFAEALADFLRERTAYADLLVERLLEEGSDSLTERLRELIDEQEAYASVLRDLDEAVFARLYEPLNHLRAQRYAKLEPFRLATELQTELEDAVDALNRRGSSATDSYLELALCLIDILKHKHGEHLKVAFKQGISVRVYTQPVFES